MSFPYGSFVKVMSYHVLMIISGVQLVLEEADMVRRMSLTLDRYPGLDEGSGEDPVDFEMIAAMENCAGALPDIVLPQVVELEETRKPEDDYYDLTSPDIIGMGV